MKVLLIGLNHKYQLEGFDSEWINFESYLIDVCSREKTDLIAEELNNEAIQLWRANGSVAKRVAKRIAIEHIFCDPERKQRSILGIKSRKEIALDLGYGYALTHQQSEEVYNIEKSYWGIREKYWLDKIISHDFERCVFLIGSDHIDSFCTLLEDNNIQFHVIDKKWQP